MADFDDMPARHDLKHTPAHAAWACLAATGYHFIALNGQENTTHLHAF